MRSGASKRKVTSPSSMKKLFSRYVIILTYGGFCQITMRVCSACYESGSYFQGGEFNPNDFELLCPIGDEPSADPSLDAFASNYNDATDFSR